MTSRHRIIFNRNGRLHFRVDSLSLFSRFGGRGAEVGTNYFTRGLYFLTLSGGRECGRARGGAFDVDGGGMRRSGDADPLGRNAPI